MVVKKFVRYLIEIFSHIYSYDIHLRFRNIKNTGYSFWIRNSFKNCGETIRIQAPAYIKGGKYMSIGDNFSSLERLRIECWDKYNNNSYNPRLIIGDNVNMNYNVHIGCINEVIIGNNVLFGSNILITDHQHGHIDETDIDTAPTKRNLSTSGPVIIEDNVWIGENVAIMPGVTIGKNCIIGANSVVTKKFPENCVIGGVPARIIKYINKN
jgi:acetyltransferase-like isoleucine patch superfamily enzyme